MPDSVMDRMDQVGSMCASELLWAMRNKIEHVVFERVCTSWSWKMCWNDLDM